MLESFFVLSDSGEVILEKQWSDKGGDRSICAWYWEHRQAEERGSNLMQGNLSIRTGLASEPLDTMDELYLRDGGCERDLSQPEAEVGNGPASVRPGHQAEDFGHKPPVLLYDDSDSHPSSAAPAVSPMGLIFSAPRCYVVSLDSNAGNPEGHDNGSHVVFVATTARELQPLLALELLRQLEHVLIAYLGSVTEDFIKDHFVTVYNVLDEIMGLGLPFSPELAALKEVVPPPSVVGKVVDKITGGVGTLSSSSPWSSSISSASAAGAAAAAAAAAAAPVSQLFAAASAAIGHGGGKHSLEVGGSSGGGSSTGSHISTTGFGSDSFRGSGGENSGSSGASSTSTLSNPTAASSRNSHAVLPWRRVPLKYMHNEISFEFFEDLDVVISSDGATRRADILGKLIVSCHLSGMPELSLSLVNPGLLSDVTLHRSVRANVWASDGIASFVPPDGSFTLLTYRVRGIQSIPIYVKPQITFQKGVGRVSIMVGSTKSHQTQQQQQQQKQQQPNSIVDALGASGGLRPVDGLKLAIHLPLSVVASDLTSNVGSVLFDSVSKVLLWEIGRMPRDRIPCLSGGIQLEGGVDRPVGRPRILASFKVPGAALSGLRIEGLTVRNETYFVHKGFRSCTRSATFEVRT